jgi:hypothetical protein
LYQNRESKASEKGLNKNKPVRGYVTAPPHSLRSGVGPDGPADAEQACWRDALELTAAAYGVSPEAVAAELPGEYRISAMFLPEPPLPALDGLEYQRRFRAASLHLSPGIDPVDMRALVRLAVRTWPGCTVVKVYEANGSSLACARRWGREWRSVAQGSPDYLY